MQELINDFMRWARSKGRLGGVLILAMAAVLLFAAYALYDYAVPENGRISFRGLGFSFLLGLFGLGMLIGAVGQIIRPQPPPEQAWGAEDVDHLAVKAMREPRPFWVCTKCRLLFTARECDGRCLQCAKTSNCQEVATDEDLEILLADLGYVPAPETDAAPPVGSGIPANPYEPPKT